MERRKFISSSLAASALAAVSSTEYMQAAAIPGREYYQLRLYRLFNGPHRKVVDAYFRDALIPALNRLGITPVGVFNLTIGPQTPTVYVLMPSTSLDVLVNVEDRLAQDSEYMKAGEPFLNTPADHPMFDRIDSSLLQAFEKMPKLKVPPATASHTPRIFEMRTYESATDQDHKRKVEMMQSGEEKIFDEAGFFQVFYGDMLVGPRIPNLTYMLSYENLTARDKAWANFISAPAWKKMTSDPRYSFEEIVSKITNVILTPTDYSQI
ncbi:MAG TPA: NIPSNAP family protein [Terriglobales bacterium]|jgi:hypothetical protein|nr:NIPSNAP family protein [Terriglobales bacterium]